MQGSLGLTPGQGTKIPHAAIKSLHATMEDTHGEAKILHMATKIPCATAKNQCSQINFKKIEWDNDSPKENQNKYINRRKRNVCWTGKPNRYPLYFGIRDALFLINDSILRHWQRERKQIRSWQIHSGGANYYRKGYLET